MKGFIVVDRMNDVHFIDTDHEFSRHVNKQALDNGLLQEDDIDWTTIHSNIIMQQFSPLIMSQWYMIDTAKNPCSSITCENGFLFVFKHFSDFLIIAINGDGTETEDFLTRKCLVFIRLIQFLFGPVSQEIGRPMFTTKPERWDFLRRILTTWVDLVSKEQAFLMEAVERLHVNQMLNEQCIELLRMGINSVQAAGEKHTQHALLLVNSKLLALYSHYTAYELSAADILCIVILMCELFPTNERLEDLFSHSYSNYKRRSVPTRPVEAKVADRYESAHEGLTEGDDSEEDHEQYLSAVESPSVAVQPGMGSSESSGTSSNNNIPVRAGARTPYPEVSESFHTSREGPTPDELKDSIEEELAGLEENVLPTSKRRSQTMSGIEALRSREERMDSGESYSGRVRSRSCLVPHTTQEEASYSVETTQGRPGSSQDEGDQVSSEFPAAETGLIKQTIFLNTPICTYAPYQVHCQRIFPGMVLVVLSEMPLINQAGRLVQVLQLLKDLLNGSKDTLNRSQGQMLYDIINSQLVKILLSLKQATGHLQKLRNDVKSRWDSEELKIQMLSFLERVAGTDVPSSLERSLKSLHNKILEIFVHLYLYPCPLTEPMVVTMGEIRGRIAKKLADYREYLTVKAQRNITMTSYIVEFPGLIHFIYVNRRTNQITAPALNIVHLDESNVDANQYLKDKIWSKVSWMLQKLYTGCISVTAREGDFHYSYFLWFEDLSGDPKVIQKLFQPDIYTPLPGILAGNFYKDLIRKCFPNSVPGSIQCNELFMMHVGLAPAHYIASQCRQLAAVLWDTTGEAFTPINLL